MPSSTTSLFPQIGDNTWESDFASFVQVYDDNLELGDGFSRNYRFDRLEYPLVPDGDMELRFF
jgi:hypothetical protein